MDKLLHSTSFEQPPLNRAEIIRYARAHQLDTAQDALLDECLTEILPLLAYRVCWRFYDIKEAEDGCLDLGFARLSSQSLAQHLKGARHLMLFAATIGIEADRMLSKYGRLSPVKGLFMQAIGAERIEALCDEFCAQIASIGLNLRPRFSPGYGDLPIQLQKDIFSVLDCPRQIGLTLTDSFLMSPTKSVTALVGF